MAWEYPFSLSWKGGFAVEGVNSTFNIDAFYETLIDQTPLGIAIQTPDGKVARANRAFCEMFGYTPGEVVGSRLDDLVARDEDLSADAGELTELVLRGRSNLAERVRVRKDGSRFPALIWGVPIVQGDKVLAVYAIYEDISERKAAERELARERSLLERIVIDSPDGMILFDEEGTVLRTNPAFDGIFGLEQEEVLGRHLWEILGGGGKEDEIRGRIRQLRDEKRLDYDAVRFRKDGSEVHLSIRSVAIAGDGPTGEYLAVYRDITSRAMVQHQLATERTYFENLFMNSPLAIALVGGDGIIQRVNDSFERLFGYYSFECVGADLDELIAPGDLLGDAVGLTRGAAAGSTIKAERTRRRKDGSWVEVQINAVSFPAGDGTSLVYAIYQDITERKILDEKIRFFGCHDALTGLYNQSFFEEELRRLDSPRQLPMSLVVADLDNLKLINDAFGHLEGDSLLTEAGTILRSCCRQEDIIARIGGDEFIMLLPQTTLLEARSVCDRVRRACERSQGGMIPLSMALGAAAKEEVTQDLMQVRKKADDDMYLDKLTRGERSRSAIYSRIVEFLDSDPRMKSHISRVRGLAHLFGKHLALRQDEMEKLALLARFHDVGLMPIPAEVLYKKGPLDPGEWEDVRRHPERGYRLARNLAPMSSIAEEILCHQEKFDGSGYPRGLSGEDIPRLSRVIHLLCAYEAMTGWRSYRSSLSSEEALEEIALQAGRQFDPRLAGVFVQFHRTLEAGNGLP